MDFVHIVENMFYSTNIIEKRSVCQIIQLPRPKNIDLDNKTFFSYAEVFGCVNGVQYV